MRNFALEPDGVRGFVTCDQQNLPHRYFTCVGTCLAIRIQREIRRKFVALWRQFLR